MRRAWGAVVAAVFVVSGCGEERTPIDPELVRQARERALRGDDDLAGTFVAAENGLSVDLRGTVDVSAEGETKLTMKNDTREAQVFLFGRGTPPLAESHTDNGIVLAAQFTCPFEYVHDCFHAEEVNLGSEGTRTFRLSDAPLDDLRGKGPHACIYRTLRSRDLAKYPVKTPSPDAVELPTEVKPVGPLLRTDEPELLDVAGLVTYFPGLPGTSGASAPAGYVLARGERYYLTGIDGAQLRTFLDKVVQVTGRMKTFSTGEGAIRRTYRQLVVENIREREWPGGGNRAEDVQLTAMSERDAYASGEALLFFVRLSNAGERDRLIIYDGDDAMRTGIAGFMTLELTGPPGPGQAGGPRITYQPPPVVETRDVQPTFLVARRGEPQVNPLRLSPAFLSPRLTPGTYRARFTVSSRPARFYTAGTLPGGVPLLTERVTSNEVTFEVK